MSLTREQIFAEAMALDPEERAELIQDLYQVVEESELTDEQLAEIRRRAHEIDTGQVTMIPAEEALRRLRERSRK
jgi:putative addiction module component (TIGR02574 family)